MKIRQTLVAVAIFLLAQTAGASYLINGNFEQAADSNGITNHKSWEQLGWDVWSDLPGWQTLYGPGIEVQHSGVVTTAQSGSHYIELDSHNGSETNSGMFQQVLLEEGHYNLSFWYFARTNTQNDNGIFAGVSLSNTPEAYLFRTVADSTRELMGNAWQEMSLRFYIDTPSTYNISFGALESSIDNSLGGFIDNVSLIQNPEPQTLLLLGLGLLGVTGTARRKRQS